MPARRHQYRNLASRLYGAPLAIDPEKLDTLIETFEFLRTGARFTEAELAERLGLAAAESRRERLAIDLFDLEADDEDAPYQLVNGVAVLPLAGVIEQKMNAFSRISGGMSTEVFGQHFQQAIDDPEVRAILLDTDSPGGSTSGVPELADQIFSARGSKPIVAVANAYMASAAYWIGSAADSVVASPSALVGSIGVYMVHSDRSQANAARGIKHTVIKAGRFKASTLDVSPLSAEGREHLTDIVERTYDQFVAAVAKQRRASTEAVRSGYGQARVLLAEDAVRAGLADRVATLPQILGELAQRSTSITVPAFGRQLAEPQLPASSLTKENPTVDPKLKAALVARGLITAEASDAEANIALRSFFAARGVSQPAAVDDAVAALGSAAPAAPAATAPATPVAAPASPAPAPVAASPSLTQAEREAAAREERARISDITARGRLLGADEATIERAIADGIPVATAVMRFTDALATTNSPVSSNNDVRVEGAPIERIVSGAAEAMAFRCGIQPRGADGQPRPLSVQAAPFQRMSLVRACAEMLRSTGRRIDSDDPMTIAEEALKLTGTTPIVMRADGSFNSPGMFPNLFSALAGKMLDSAMEAAAATYRRWCSQMPSVSDFQPKTLIRLGGSGELPRVPDGDDYPQSTKAEEANWLQVDTYGDEFTITPRMIVNDDLGGFQDLARDKQVSHELTLNRLCVNLLTGNPTLPDGTAFFAAGHGSNDITGGSGGVPSQAQLKLIRTRMRLQQDVGSNRRLRLGPAIIVVPVELEADAEQTLAPLGVVPAVDTNINTFRTKVDWVVEPMLSDASAAIWYAFADPRMIRTIVFTFLQGYENGRRETYYWPKSGCQVFKITGNFAAAVMNYRGAVRNAGA